MAATLTGHLLDRMRRLTARTPRWARILLGVVLAGLGVLIVLRPFVSLTVLMLLIAGALVVGGVARLVEAGRMPHPLLARVAGAAEVLGGVLVVAWPLASVQVLALVAGVVLLISGAADAGAAFARTPGGRAAHALRGVAFLVLGVLSIVWPDVSLIVIAVVFAVRLVLLGIELVVRALRRASDAPRPGRGIRALDLVGRGALAVLAVVALVGSILLHQDTPRPTAFYDAPATVPAGPGHLIRSQPYTQAVPEGARGWLILYTTTDLNGAPSVGSGFVMAPADAASAPRDVVLWTHGTQGADRACAPTLLPEPLPLAEPIAALEQQLAEGRVLVGPDYPGMGTVGPQGYLVGQNEGRSSLDAVRAAHELPGLELSRRTVVWGHSQGGQAALWTGGLAPDYAPELELLGVAAAAPAADVRGLIATLGDSVIGQVMGPYAVRAYAETYPDVRVRDYVDARMFPIYEAASRRCLPARATLVSLLTALTMQGRMYAVDPATGPLGERLDENVPTLPVAVPLFIGQGGADPLILPEVQARFIASRCAAGQELIYREYAGRDHLSVVADDSPFSAELLAWTDDRFAGRPQSENTCP